jgi:hypothetical protein
MKSVILASLVLATTAFAQASEVTVLSTNLPATRGYTSVDTKFHIDTEMKEAFAEIEVEEQITTYVRSCNGGYNGPGYNYPGPRYPYPGPGYPYPGSGNPGRYCQTIPQTQYRSILSNRVKIEDMTMNGNDVIYQSAEGDIVCGTMGRSRVFRVPTFYLSGKCSLVGKIVNDNGVSTLSVKFITK